MSNIKILLNGQLDDYEVRSLHSSKATAVADADNNHCKIVNITLCGAMVLVPRHIIIPDTRLKITIPSSAIKLARDTVIHSEIRWANVDSQTDCTRLGLMFTDMQKQDRLELKKMLLELDSPNDTSLPCLLAAA